MVEMEMRNDPAYIKLRASLIKQFEGQYLWVYTDHKGKQKL
jgi:hypothetical protein